MHLADLRSYLEADQRLLDAYADPEAWARKAILNIAGSGQILQRPHDCRVRRRHLERGALSDTLSFHEQDDHEIPTLAAIILPGWAGALVQERPVGCNTEKLGHTSSRFGAGRRYTEVSLHSNHRNRSV